ncbi:hypothetical protein [Bradyrhizobium iriomotense]|uniref:hypothetical protein n=1 Tax=Bradyrhizobium iriomotense TaxID=441950 RepID=UPI001B8A4D30|nr:hypothetical protein [Bradyrhizobium iriomotense]MBR0780759.1 hypothetical protein [Bradyrhizobium iriomotense]
MLGFFICNLIIPGEPDHLEITTPAGVWTLGKYAEYEKSKAAINNGQCADTYYIEMNIPLVPSARADAALEQLTPILLAASYAVGLVATISKATLSSEVKFMQTSHQWPRARAVDRSSPVVTNPDEFKTLVENFVAAYPSAGQTEKALLLIHHWLDALACWSLEDLYLSATTLLQIIVATEETRQNVNRLSFYDGVTDAANRIGLRVLSTDFKNMRNEIVHGGQLIGSRFRGPGKAECDAVVADVLNWFDEYLHKALQLGPVAKTRFTAADFSSLNAFSIS